MRKKIVTIMIVLLIVGGLCAVEQVAVMRYTDGALEMSGQILQTLRVGDLSTGLEKAHELDTTWDEWAQRLELVIDHGSSDEVRYALSRLIAALEGEDRASALIYASELEGSIEHVRERQELSAQNLL